MIDIKAAKFLAICFSSFLLLSCAPSAVAPSEKQNSQTTSVPISAQETNVERPLTEAIDHVWSGQRVWFDFVEQGDFQMIAYYDAMRQMSVAVRKMNDVNGGPWSYHKLPSYLGWDAHNKVEAAFDKKGIIHVVGNLHANKLVYFRSTSPYDPRTLEQVKVMAVEADEQRMTYPEFFKSPDGILMFKYRDGTSGQGRWFYNRWDVDAQKWSHLHDTVLLDGEGIRGVYPLGPIIGPDGYAHMTFTWRETPIASSNHDLSYARSKDLVNWERYDGTPITLPITLATGEILDPIPQHGGLLNGRHPIGFDSQNRVLVTYQKYDEAKKSQIYIARRDSDGWFIKAVSNWKDVYADLDKSGALNLPLTNSEPAFVDDAGNIIVRAVLYGELWEWHLEHDSLDVISGGIVEDALPSAITQYDLENDIPQRVIPLMENQTTKSREYFLSWEALQPNRDQARPDIPPASTLRVHRIPQ